MKCAPTPTTSTWPWCPEGMAHAHSETLEFRLSLADPKARADLLAMTPHGWRASAEKRARVIEQPRAVRSDGFHAL
jgi:23S rRNA m(1)G-745 methyltransferase (EC 2.1.1.51)